jgi:hypothetical protein
LGEADAAFGDFNCVLMQDNARLHVLKSMMKVLFNLSVSELANWSASSPDRNIIEVIWAIMKRRTEGQHPKKLDKWKAVLIDVWDNFSVVKINGLAAQMPTRVAQVTAEGAHTIHRA